VTARDRHAAYDLDRSGGAGGVSDHGASPFMDCLGLAVVRAVGHGGAASQWPRPLVVLHTPGIGEGPLALMAALRASVGFSATECAATGEEPVHDDASWHIDKSAAHNQAQVLNAANLARGLGVDGKTVAGYLDLLVDLLLVRRLPAWHHNVGKRLVKSPKVYVRDSGIAHASLACETKKFCSVICRRAELGKLRHRVDDGRRA
jgi:uncharacterized protein DUF4143